MKDDFREWLETNRDSIRNWLKSIVALTKGKLRIDDEDIVQDVLTEAVRAPPVEEDERRRYAWLRTVCRHKICDHARKQKLGIVLKSEMESEDSQTRFELFLVGRESSVGGKLLRAERAEKVTAALVQLSNDERQAILLFYIEGITAIEIGEIIGRSTVAVRSLKVRALEKLRDILGPDIF